MEKQVQTTMIIAGFQKKKKKKSKPEKILNYTVTMIYNNNVRCCFCWTT